MKLNEDGTYNLIIGAADMGTGCDTILAQMVAECMDCTVDDVTVFGADTDASPYDSGSYASSTTYVTGGATVKACEELKSKICAIAAEMFGCEKDSVEFGSGQVKNIETGDVLPLEEVGIKSQLFNTISPEATVMHSSPVSGNRTHSYGERNVYRERKTHREFSDAVQNSDKTRLRKTPR